MKKGEKKVFFTKLELIHYLLKYSNPFPSKKIILVFSTSELTLHKNVYFMMAFCATNKLLKLGQNSATTPSRWPIKGATWFS